ncbi:MAG: hypothetical protein P8Z37_07130 [Acidobacteriota bacterium]
MQKRTLCSLNLRKISRITVRGEYKVHPYDVICMAVTDDAPYQPDSMP